MASELPQGDGGATYRNAAVAPSLIVVQSLTTSRFFASRLRRARTRAQYAVPLCSWWLPSVETVRSVRTPEGLWLPGLPSGVHAVDAVRTFQLSAALEDQLQTWSEVPGTWS